MIIMMYRRRIYNGDIRKNNKKKKKEEGRKSRRIDLKSIYLFDARPSVEVDGCVVVFICSQKSGEGE